MRACIAVWIALAVLFGQQVIRLGERQTLLDDGQFGLQYFPDGGVTLLPGTEGSRWLLAAGVSSYLLEGADVASLHLLKKVLGPGPKGAFDNGYAGIFSAYTDRRTGEVLAVYHAEDQEEMARLANL